MREKILLKASFVVTCTVASKVVSMSPSFILKFAFSVILATSSSLITFEERMCIINQINLVNVTYGFGWISPSSMALPPSVMWRVPENIWIALGSSSLTLHFSPVLSSPPSSLFTLCCCLCFFLQKIYPLGQLLVPENWKTLALHPVKRQTWTARLPSLLLLFVMMSLFG